MARGGGKEDLLQIFRVRLAHFLSVCTSSGSSHNIGDNIFSLFLYLPLSLSLSTKVSLFYLELWEKRKISSGKYEKRHLKCEFL